ncbi:hypothetical protein FB451DRAFT_1446376 [Mycena latifolia]|nr:hypothetical protein FB451DRAFT_1446376 [Mycena latifolia]
MVMTTFSCIAVLENPRTPSPEKPRSYMLDAQIYLNGSTPALIGCSNWYNEKDFKFPEAISAYDLCIQNGVGVEQRKKNIRTLVSSTKSARSCAAVDAGNGRLIRRLSLRDKPKRVREAGKFPSSRRFSASAEKANGEAQETNLLDIARKRFIGDVIIIRSVALPFKRTVAEARWADIEMWQSYAQTGGFEAHLSRSKMPSRKTAKNTTESRAAPTRHERDINAAGGRFATWPSRRLPAIPIWRRDFNIPIRQAPLAQNHHVGFRANILVAQCTSHRFKNHPLHPRNPDLEVRSFGPRAPFPSNLLEPPTQFGRRAFSTSRERSFRAPPPFLRTCRGRGAVENFIWRRILRTSLYETPRRRLSATLPFPPLPSPRCSPPLEYGPLRMHLDISRPPRPSLPLRSRSTLRPTSAAVTMGLVRHSLEAETTPVRVRRTLFASRGPSSQTDGPHFKASGSPSLAGRRTRSQTMHLTVRSPCFLRAPMLGHLESNSLVQPSVPVPGPALDGFLALLYFTLLYLPPRVRVRPAAMPSVCKPDAKPPPPSLKRDKSSRPRARFNYTRRPLPVSNLQTFALELRSTPIPPMICSTAPPQANSAYLDVCARPCSVDVDKCEVRTSDVIWAADAELAGAAASRVERRLGSGCTALDIMASARVLRAQGRMGVRRKDGGADASDGEGKRQRTVVGVPLHAASPECVQEDRCGVRCSACVSKGGVAAFARVAIDLRKCFGMRKEGPSVLAASGCRFEAGWHEGAHCVRMRTMPQVKPEEYKEKGGQMVRCEQKTEGGGHRNDAEKRKMPVGEIRARADSLRFHVHALFFASPPRPPYVHAAAELRLRRIPTEMRVNCIRARVRANRNEHRRALQPPALAPLTRASTPTSYVRALCRYVSALRAHPQCPSRPLDHYHGRTSKEKIDVAESAPAEPARRR